MSPIKRTDQGGVKILKDGRVIRRSRNLRCLMDYTRSHITQSVTVNLTGEYAPRPEALLTVVYRDGATCTTEFLSFSVLVDWLLARRSWQGLADFYAGDAWVGKFDKSNANLRESLLRGLCGLKEGAA